MGIGISSFTEIVGAGPSHDFDILGLKMFDSCEIRVHPTGKVLARIGVQTQGQGHETTFAQIIAEELGFPVGDIKIEYGDTDTAPYGLGTYAVALDAGRRRGHGHRRAQDPRQGPQARRPPARGLRGRPRVGARQVQRQGLAGPVQDHPGDRLRGLHQPSRRGWRPGLEAVDYYDPPNLTFPFGSYICVVDIDKGTGQVKVRRFVAVDDCGNIINPMIVDGQIHGGLTMGLAPALYEEITYDELGNNMAGTFMDYLLPTAVETPAWELEKTVTPSPHHPIGAKGVGESATVGAPPAIANAVVDALWHLGVRNIDIPITPQKVWAILHEKGVAMMADRSSLARAPSWRPAGRPFAVATVVAVRRPTSARPGASGIVHPDGSDRGLGRRQLRAARRRPRGAPRDRRRPAAAAPAVADGPAEGRRADGVIELVMTCHSGGTLEIYVEPHLPGRAALGRRDDADRRRPRRARLGRRLAGDRHRPDRRGRRLPGRRGSTARPTSAASIRRRRPLRGRGQPGHLGRGGRRLCADPRVRVRRPRRLADPGGVVRDWLREETTVGEERIAALRAPAGLDIGAETAEEIALSILAELVQVRRGRADFVASPGPATVAGGLPESITLEPVVDDIVLLDPVCGMTVERAHARHLAEHDGIVYAFCSIGCRTRFIKEPATYLDATDYSPMHD